MTSCLGRVEPLGLLTVSSSVCVCVYRSVHLFSTQAPCWLSSAFYSVLCPLQSVSTPVPSTVPAETYSAQGTRAIHYDRQVQLRRRFALHCLQGSRAIHVACRRRRAHRDVQWAQGNYLGFGLRSIQQTSGDGICRCVSSSLGNMRAPCVRA